MKAGSLEIQILADIASLQVDMNRMKRTVGGGIDAVTASLAGGERALQSFGGRFGEFARLAESSAQRAERAFEESFADIQRLASNAINMPRLAGGGVNLGAGEARAAAEAAREHAQAIALVEAAAKRAAAGTGTMTQETRMYLAAAEAARIEAERNAAEMGREAAAVERLESELNQLGGAQRRAEQGHRAVTVSAGQLRAGTQQLSYNISDVATQFAMGTNPMMIFAQQGSQVVQALTLMRGEVGGLLGFLGGPWGAVFMGAASIVGVFIGKAMESKKATLDVADAMQVERASIAELIQAIHERIAAESNSVRSSYAQEAAHYDAATAARTRLGEELRLTKALLQRADAQAAATSIDPEGGIAVAAAPAAIFERRMKQLDAAIKEADKNIRISHVPLIRREVTAAHDAAAGAALRFDKAEAALTEQLTRGRIGAASYQRELSRLTGVREAEIEAVREAEKAENRAEAAARAGQKRAEAAARAEAKAAERKAARLATDARAIEASIAGIDSLASAYLRGDAAALIAEAGAQAVGGAIRKQGDEAAYVERELRKMLTQRGVDAAKSIADLTAQTAAQQTMNAAVAAGTLSIEDATTAMQQELALRPLTAAKQAAEKQGYADLAAELGKLIPLLQQKRAEDEAARATAAFNANKRGLTDDVERLRAELSLIGATNRERAVELALLEARQRLRGSGMTPEQIKDILRLTAERVNAEQDLRDGVEGHNAALTRQLTIMEQLRDSAGILADDLTTAFGRVGGAIGDVIGSFTEYAAQQERIRLEEKRRTDQAGQNQVALAEVARWSARERSNAEFRYYGDAISAAKGLFKEQSAGHKAMVALEKTLAVLRIANMVKTLATDILVTTKSVANSATRGSADAAAGAAKMFSFLGPFAFPVVAAMVAVLATMGLKGLSGGGSGPSIPTAEDIQKQQGTGSVLGDSEAKSGSIGASLNLMLKNSNKDLEYASEAVRALRAIESNLGNLAAAVAREMSVGGGLDASSLQLGTNTSGGLLGVGGLFSKKITRELNDAGLQFDGTSVAQAIAGGIQADLYQEVLKTTKKSGLFGIGGSTKTSIETTRTAADAGLTTEVALLIGNMRKAIVEAAGTIGIDGAAALLDAFQINIGRISFKDLTAEEIESELAAVFSRVGDDMAGAVGGGLSAFQRAGEGMLETLVRLAKEYQTVDVALRSIGMTFGQVGAASVGARTALVDLFGGLDAFTEQTAFFRENFLSEAEQMAPVIAAVKAEMERLGLAGVTTKDAFKSVVLGLDLSTERGRETYAALMAVAPAFAKTSDYLASLSGELKETAKTAEQLAAIEKQRRALDIQLMEATGNTAGALAAKRADELAAMDESLRGLQQQVWSALDAAQAQRELVAANEEASRAAAAAADEAARTAAAIAQQRRGLEIALMEAMGDAAGALAARRSDELAAMDASLRALQEQVWAAEAATAAQAALAEAQAAAAQTALALAQQRRSMEIELMEALGDAAGALAARRADELAGTDASLRALREQIYSAQDAAAANAALAQAQDNAAQAARTAADAAAQLARQRAGLEIALMRAQGQEAQAVSAERALELDALDASLRGLQAQVWAAEDARAAAEAAARAQADMLSAAKQAADDAEQLRKQRVGLQVELLDAMGDAAGALALRRAEELAAMDASLRGMQQMVWRQQDIAAAVSKARETLTDSYKRESDALTETIDRFGGFGESLRKFRGELGMGDSAVGDAYRAAQARFVDASSLAAIGDAKALGELEGISKEFLAASRDRAGSLAEYQRDVARVAGSVDRAIGATDEAVDYAQAQLEALKSSVAGLVDINENVVSVRDAILALRDAEAGRSVPAVPAVPVTALQGGGQTIQVSTAELERRIDALSQRLEVQNTAVAENTGRMARFMARWDDDGLPTRDVEETA